MGEKRTVIGEKVTPESGLSWKQILVVGVGTLLLFLLFEQLRTAGILPVPMGLLAGIAGGVAAHVAIKYFPTK